MAKKSKKEKGAGDYLIGIQVPTTAIIIESKADAVAALEEMEQINEMLTLAQARTVDLKKNVTAWAVDKRVDVIQLDGHYYRQINRVNRGWDNDVVEAITSKISVVVNGKKKKLWNLITSRVVDPEKIDKAVKKKWISEEKISKAFVEKPQAPFLQKFQGDAVDA